MDIPIIKMTDADRKELRDNLTNALCGAVGQKPESVKQERTEVHATAGDGSVMDAHRRTMEQILASHEEIMNAMLATAKVHQDPQL